MIRVYVDSREAQSGVPDLLRQMGVTVIQKQLSVGDYVVAEDVGIERKTASDFVSSLIDKRLFDQASRLSSSYSLPLMIIEGDLYSQMFRLNSINSLPNSMVSLALDYGIRIILTTDKSSTASSIVKIAEKTDSVDGKSHRSITLHDKPKFQSQDDMVKYVLESFPNIGEVTAEKLLSKFPDLISIFNADLPTLVNIVGRKKAETLYNLLRYRKPSSRTLKVRSLTEFSNTKDETNKNCDDKPT